MKVQTIVGSLAIAAVVVGCETVKDGQTEEVAKDVGTIAADGEYVPGLQQGVFLGLARQFRTNFDALFSSGKSCADADQQTRTLGTILADVNGISHATTNELTGRIEVFCENAAILYEGEIYLRGGVEYNFYVCVDDWASIEIDGNQFLRGGYGAYRRFRLRKGSSLIASKTVEKTGWYPIRVWMCDVKHGGTAMFGGRGIGWNDSGCKEVTAENFSQWHPLRDDGSGRFLRTKHLPQKEETAKAATEKSGN